MTLASLHNLTADFLKHGVPGNNEVLAYDAEIEALAPVTGLVFDDKFVEVQTDGD